MAYSVNPETIENRRPMYKEFYKALESGKPAKIEIARDPLVTRRVARQLREVLYIAARYPERYPKLAEAAERFAIVEVRDGLIEARFKPTKVETSFRVETSIQGLEPQGKPVPSVNVTTAAQIIESWKKHLPSSDPIHFKQTVLDEVELTKLWEWATSWKPKLMILIGDHTLTLSHRDPTVSEFAWRPINAVDEEEEELDV